MGKLFCLLGKSGSGKDTVLKALIGDPDLKLRGVVGYTTRPRRENETDGVEYHFITSGDLDRLKKEGRIIELRYYDTVKGRWYYATVDDGGIDLDDHSYLMTATLESFRSLCEYFGREKVVPLCLKVEDGVRLQRLLERETREHAPNYEELCRRFLADNRDFSSENLAAGGIAEFFDNCLLESCLGNIKFRMKACMKAD